MATIQIVPQLSFRNNRWVLSQNFKEGSVELVINHSWNGKTWDDYKIFICDTGDRSEVVSEENFDVMYEAVCNYEGQKVAGKWLESKQVLHNNSSTSAAEAYKIGKELIQRWESMQTLGLFSPSVTL